MMQGQPYLFDKLWKEGNRDEAKDVARRYINDHRHQLAPILESMSLEDIVQMIDSYRAAGKEEDRIIADMWLITQYEPRRIQGAVHLGNPMAAVKEVENFLKNEV